MPKPKQEEKESVPEIGRPKGLEQYMDAEYLLNPREVVSLDRNIYSVVRAKAVLQTVVPTIPIMEGSKSHELSIETELDPPIFSDDFMTEDLDETHKAASTFYPAYMHKDFYLKKTEIDISRANRYYNIDIVELNTRGAMKTIADYKERVLFRGYDIKGRSAANKQGSIDTNVKGVMNTSSINTFEAGAGGDDDITAAGDGPFSVGNALNSLVDDLYFGPYWLFITPMCKGRLARNQNTTTHISDLERMISMIDEGGNKILRGIKVTPYLINATETTTTGAMAMFDPKTPENEPTTVVLEVYPVSHYPTAQNQLYVKGKVLWAGVEATIRPKAWTIAVSLTQT